MKNWKKMTLSAAAVAGAALVLVGCTSGGSKDTAKNLQWNLSTKVNTLDSGLATDTYSNALIGNTESGATRVDASGQAANELAKDIQVSPDGLTYTIDLRSGLKWSNGDKLTAKDFVYGWQRNLDPKTKSQYAYLMGVVKNANDINAGKLDKKELGVEAKSDTQLVVTLTQATPYFKYLLAQSVFYPLNQKVVEKYGSQYGTSSSKMVYSGPYKFDTSKGWNGSNTSFSIIKNKDYFDAAAVKMKQIDFQVVTDPNTAIKLYQQGKLDEAGIGSPDLYKKYKDDKNRTDFKEATTAYIEYNQSDKGATSPDAQKALANAKIRQAINLATNRADYLTATLPASAPATGMTPAGMSKTSSGVDFAEFAKQGYTYDPTQAAQLFKEGLQEVGLSSLTLTLTTDDTPAAKDGATYMQQNWQKDLPGLTLNVKTEPFKQRLNDAQTGNFDMILSLWGGDYADPSTFLDLMTTGNPQNSGKFSNPAYDAAVKAAETTDATNPEAHDNDFKAAEAALFEQSNINPIYFRTSPYLLNSKVKDVGWGSTGLIWNFKNATKEAASK